MVRLPRTGTWRKGGNRTFGLVLVLVKRANGSQSLTCPTDLMVAYGRLTYGVYGMALGCYYDMTYNTCAWKRI